MLKTIYRTVSLCAFVLVLPLTASAQFNGLKTDPRVINGSPGSTLTISNSNSIPGNVTIDDRNLNPSATDVNRDDVLLSTDNGATAHTFSSTEGFTFSASVKLTDGVDSPRKEAGIRINEPVTGDTLLIVNSDAGEIVSFGGGAPFHLFGNNSSGDGYTPGQTILLGITYRPGSPTNSAATPATIEYFIDRGAGIVSSGAQPYSNLEAGPVTFQVGVYEQAEAANANDFVTAQFTNIQAADLPEPASLGMLALSGLTLLARRRSNFEPKSH